MGPFGSESRLEPGRRPDGVPARAAVLAVAAGAGFDLALNGQWPGISAALVVAGYAAVVAAVSQTARSRTILLAAAVAFGAFSAVHGAPWLVAADLLIAAVLLASAAGWPAAGARTMRAAVAAAARPVLVLPWVPSALAAPAGTFVRGRLRRVLAAVRAAALVVAVAGVLGALLASADAVFGRLVERLLPSWSPGGLAGHAVLFAVGLAGAGALVVSAASRRAPGPDRTAPARRLSPWEGIAVLAAVDLLYAAFAAVQAVALFGGAGRVLVTPGLTYAEYARTGFAQLTVAAALTGAVIVAVWDLGRRGSVAQRRAFRWLVAAMVALTLVILASALWRLTLYERAFGFTVRRLVAAFAIAWIGWALLATLWTVARERRQALFGLLAAGALVLGLGINGLGPDRFVAERNVARYQATGAIDAAYLGALGPGAVPVAVETLPAVGPEDRARLRSALCANAGLSFGGGDWRSWNRAREVAERALRSAGITRDACGGQAAGAGAPS